MKTELNLQSVEWQEFKISDIFQISGTITTHPSKLQPKGKIPRITCAATNNGLDTCYKNEPTESGGVLTLDSATTAYVGYQEYDFIATDHIEKIMLKQRKMSRYVGLFIKHCIDKACVVDDKTEVKKYAYGYKCSQARIKRQIIKLPINSQGEPDYEFMEKFMRQVEQKQIRIRVDFIKKNLTRTTPCDLSAVEWKEFYFSQIFTTIQRGKRLIKQNQKDGEIPYISSSGINNGVDNFIGNDSGVRKFKNCISLANSGSVGSAFFHSYEFVGSDHITSLSNKKFTKHIYLFLLPMISRLGEKYGFNREINDPRIKREKLLLPVNSQGQPDYEFMENFMRGVEQRQLKKALGYYSAKLAELDKFAKLDGQNGAKS